MRALYAHRLREGPQWDVRRRVSQLAAGPWRDFCTLHEAEMSEPEFMQEIGRHAFVLCAEGGGLDPAPKAWHALLHGAIPIIRDTPLRAAYELFPVVFVKNWQSEALNPALLAARRFRLISAFDDPDMRAAVIEKLGIAFWWSRIAAAHPDLAAGRTA